MSNNLSKLLISDLRLWISLGCLEQERYNKQCVSFDICVVFPNPPKAVLTDNIKDSICYAHIVDLVKTVVEGKQYKLVERLATDVYDVIDSYLQKKEFNSESLSVKVTKTSPPVPDVHGGISFTYCGKSNKSDNDKK